MLYCGLDLGKKNSVFCIVDGDRKVVGRGRVETRLKPLLSTFGDCEPMRIVLEASSKSFWVAEQLSAMGHDVRLVDPNKTKAIGSAMIKNDRRDAKMLAVLCQAELFVEVGHVDRETRLRRMNLRARDGLVQQRTKLLSAVRSLLDSEGVILPPCSSGAFTKKFPDELDASLREVVAPLLSMINAVSVQIRVYDERLKQLAAEMPIVARLRTVPGVGPLTALSFALSIREPKRFRSGREVAAYVGLVPRLYESGQTSRKGRITKQGNRTLRWLLTMAAHAVLRSKTDSALTRWGRSLVERCGRRKAVVAVARKLAVTMWAIWRDERDFEPRLPTTTTAAA